MSTDLVIREPGELDRIARLGVWLAHSESGASTPEARGATAALRIYYAQELGLPPLAAAELSVIKGRLFVGAKLLRAMAARAGYRVVKIADSPDACTAALIDTATGEEVGRVTYTIQEATAAGLVRQGSAWTTHPARMLWARASKFVLDDYAPEVTLGIYTEEEGVEIHGGPPLLYGEPPEEDMIDIPFGETQVEPAPVASEDPHAGEPGPP